MRDPAQCAAINAGRYRWVKKRVDATETVVNRGRQRCQEEGITDRVRFVLGDGCQSGLPAGGADFVWGEDAWCYVTDKPKLIAEAARIVKPGGTIAFTDWVEGPTGLSDAEAERFLTGMKFANLQDIPGYAALLRENGCTVVAAEDTGRFAAYIDLYLNMIDMQLTFDALRILGFNMDMLQMVAGEFAFTRDLARAGKLAQGRFIARRN
jgi:SAM-dependent methyltransferase